MARFNRLTAVLRESLAAMQRALAGLAVMSGELEAAARSIAVNQVGFSLLGVGGWDEGAGKEGERPAACVWV
jgi:hypothetical protein